MYLYRRTLRNAKVRISLWGRRGSNVTSQEWLLVIETSARGSVTTWPAVVVDLTLGNFFFSIQHLRKNTCVVFESHTSVLTYFRRSLCPRSAYHLAVNDGSGRQWVSHGRDQPQVGSSQWRWWLSNYRVRRLLEKMTETLLMVRVLRTTYLL